MTVSVDSNVSEDREGDWSLPEVPVEASTSVDLEEEALNNNYHLGREFGQTYGAFEATHGAKVAALHKSAHERMDVLELLTQIQGKLSALKEDVEKIPEEVQALLEDLFNNHGIDLTEISLKELKSRLSTKVDTLKMFLQQDLVRLQALETERTTIADSIKAIFERERRLVEKANTLPR